MSDRRAVYLVRHGATAWNKEGRIIGHEDIGLGEGGREQARTAARILAPCRVDLVVSSPLSRTLETARAVAADHDLEPEVDEGIVELRLAGWAGRTRAELAAEKAWQRWLREPHTIATPEGERLVDVRDRAMGALRRGLDRLPEGGGLVLVTHGGVIRVILLTLLGMPLSSYQKVRADPGSVSALELGSDGELAVLLGCNLGDPRRALRRGKPT